MTVATAQSLSVRPPAVNPADFRRILIIKPSSLGDVATTLPMLCDLKAACPNARIDWLIHPSLRALLDGHDAIHELILFDRKQLAGWFWKLSAARALVQLLGTLRRNQYDCVIDAQGLLRSGLFTRITGAATRIGFANAREGATLFYTHKVPLPKEPQVAVIRMRALLAPLGVNMTQPAAACLPIAPEADATVTRLLGSITSPAIIIPGARWDTKRWSPEGFRDIIHRLHAAGQSVVLLGSPDEKPLCDTLAAGSAVPVLNLAGKTNLAEMIALLARGKIIVGNDSGPLHVAVALNRPVVATYGPTDPNFVGPYGQLDHVIRFDVPCHPCRNRTCSHHSCMKGITTEEVWQKTRTVAGLA